MDAGTLAGVGEVGVKAAPTPALPRFAGEGEVPLPSLSGVSARGRGPCVAREGSSPRPRLALPAPLPPAAKPAAIRIAAFRDKAKKPQKFRFRQQTVHARDLDLAPCASWRALALPFGREQNGGREGHTPFARQRAFLQHLAIEIRHRPAAMQVELHHAKARTNERLDLRPRQMVGVSSFKKKPIDIACKP